MTSNSSFHHTGGALDRIGQVLIGVSFAPSDNRVVDSGLAVAEALGAKAHVLHSAWPTSLGMSGGDFKRLTDQQADEMAALLESHPAMQSPDVTFGVEVGTPYRALLRVADDLGADLIVVGAAERPGVRFGSTAEKLVRKAKCPILVVREPVRLPLESVLAPVDLSALSGDSLRCGLAFVGQMVQDRAVRVEALFVLGHLQRNMGEAFSPDQIDRFAAEELDRFVDEHGGPELGPRVARSVVVGDPRAEIVRAAAEGYPDLLILGTHGRGGTERALVGSVATSVMRRAQVNVLVVPPQVAFGAELADAIVEQTEPQWSMRPHPDGPPAG